MNTELMSLQRYSYVNANDHAKICHTVMGKPIKPKTVGQKHYVDTIRDKMIVFGVGPAGTGKTYLAMAKAITAFKAGEVNRIILTGAAGIRPKQTEAARKRSAQYTRLKHIAAAAGRIPFLRGISRNMEEALRRKYGSKDYNSLDAEMRKTFVRIVSQDLTDLYGSFRSGTLLLWGDRDTETPLWMGREMEKRIPDSALIILEGGTHFAYLEQVDRFCAIASEFLKED